MTDPFISVIMPAYNAEKYINASIESVLRQTYTHWELLIVDDGSIDNTALIVKQQQLKDARIKYFYQENSRQGKAKNLAIHHSTGFYIAFLDADDLWQKNKLEISLREINEGDYSLLFTDCYIFEGEIPTKFSGLKRMHVENAIHQGRPALLSFLNYNRIPNLTVLVKRDIMLQAGGFTDQVVAEDYEMWLRLLESGAVFKSINTPLSCYRIHDESITAQDRHATFEIIEIIKNFAKRNPAYREETQKIIQEKIRHWLYYGHRRSSKSFRVLIIGVFNFPLMAFFYTLSYFMPVNQLRKIVIRMY